MAQTSPMDAGELTKQELAERLGEFHAGQDVEIVVGGERYEGHVTESYYIPMDDYTYASEDAGFSIADHKTGVCRFFLSAERHSWEEWELTVTEFVEWDPELLSAKESRELGTLEAINLAEVSVDA